MKRGLLGREFAHPTEAMQASGGIFNFARARVVVMVRPNQVVGRKRNVTFLGKIFSGVKWVLGNLLWVLSRITLVVYLLVFRSFLYVFTLVLVLYFAVNTSYFLNTLHPLLADVLPGAITLERLQFGPSPAHVRLVGVTITDSRM